MGLPLGVEQRISRLENDTQSVYELLGEVQQKLVQHDARFDQIDRRLDAHDARFDRIDGTLETILAMLRDRQG